MEDLNLAIISGTITKDPELKMTASGTKIGLISFATVTGWNKETKESVSSFFNARCFNQAAEFVNRYAKKGMLIVIQGKLVKNNYTSASGVKRNDVEIIIDRCKLYHSKKTLLNELQTGTYVPQKATPAYVGNNSGNQEETIEVMDDDVGDLPF